MVEAPRRSCRTADGVERVGNKVPHPAVIFIILIGVVIVLSHILYLAGARVAYEVINPETHTVEKMVTVARSLLTVDGIRFMFTGVVQNFMSFQAVGVIIVAMVGVGSPRSRVRQRADPQARDRVAAGPGPTSWWRSGSCEPRRRRWLSREIPGGGRLHRVGRHPLADGPRARRVRRVHGDGSSCPSTAPHRIIRRDHIVDRNRNIHDGHLWLSSASMVIMERRRADHRPDIEPRTAGRGRPSVESAGCRRRRPVDCASRLGFIGVLASSHVVAPRRAVRIRRPARSSAFAVQNSSSSRSRCCSSRSASLRYRRGTVKNTNDS